MRFMNKKKRAFVVVIVALAAVLLLILIGGLIFFEGRKGPAAPFEAVSKDASTPNTPSSNGANPEAAKIRLPDTALTVQQKKEKRPLPGPSEAIPGQGGFASAHAKDSQATFDSVSLHFEKGADTADTSGSGCEKDTTPPWVYTDPSGGLHHTALSVKLFATKPCVIEWQIDSAGPWNVYGEETIRIEKSATLRLKATDSCGNRMEPREERYDLKPEDAVRRCPRDMEHVRVGRTSFCIDKYEWPNVKDRPPRTYVSVYQAMDTCVSAGKRLCTSDEWTIACTGPYGWNYPYGANYELYACVTNDTTARPSGSRPECRGYFGLYDMSGNCAEWTSTRSSINMRYYNVMGGFWESGPQSGCFNVRYSYFPQNRHNPVGFRCCKDALPDGTQRGAE
jgi:hypothetical protein